MNSTKLTQQDKQALIQLADEARKYSYAPYSNYRVGAALRTKSGRVFTGVNIENAAYPDSICAERTAVFKAVSEGEREFDVLAVVTDNGGAPCGSCRQVLAEFGLETGVIVADTTGKVVSETTVGELMPQAFTPQVLKKK